MATSPPGLGEVREIHEQLGDLGEQQGQARNAKLTRLQKKLRTAVEDLPPEIHKAYERIKESRGLDAIAVVESQTCRGCCFKLTLNDFNKLVLGKTVICGSCGRLLYVETDE